MTTERTTHPVDPSQVKKDHLMAFVYYTKVKDVKGSEELLVEDLDHGKSAICIRGKDLISSAMSADQFGETQKITKTAAAELLVHSANRPLSVSFDKADGTERVLRGRLVKPEPLLGRSMVEDLDTTDAHRLRQVDHRTINWLIVDGVKYVVK